MTRRKTDRRPRGGVLAVISLLMIGSAVIRLGLEAGPALAKTAEPSATKVKQTQADLPGAQVLLTELLRREDALKQREAATLNKEKALTIADQAIETRLVALQEAEEACARRSLSPKKPPRRT